MADSDNQDLPGPPEPPAHEDTMSRFAGHLVNRLRAVRWSMEGAHRIVGHGPAADRIAAATDEVDRLVREIFVATLGLVVERPAPMQVRIEHAARAMQGYALDRVALLERQARLVKAPSRLDYPTQIKRWRDFAEEAEQLARHWGQAPDPLTAQGGAGAPSHSSERELPAAVHEVAARDASAEGRELTTREQEVLKLLAQGRSAKGIARDLEISINTCRAHIRRILDKLGVHSQLAAVVQASRLGLLPGESG